MLLFLFKYFSQILCTINYQNHESMITYLLLSYILYFVNINQIISYNCNKKIFFFTDSIRLQPSLYKLVQLIGWLAQQSTFLYCKILILPFVSFLSQKECNLTFVYLFSFLVSWIEHSPVMKQISVFSFCNSLMASAEVMICQL